MKSILDDQFEKFEDIVTSESEDIWILDEEGMNKESEEDLYPALLGSPLRNHQPINNYREEVRNYYESLSIQQRLNLLKEIYCEEPQTYKVIFNIIGVSFSQKFTIGQVEFYSAKQDGQYINQNSKKNQLYSKIYFASNPKDFELRTDYCVAVDVQGVDNKFMAIKAKQIAERTIAALSKRNRKERPVILLDDWVICNSQGNIKNLSFTRFYTAENITEFAGKSKNDYREKIGRWISSENRCHPTVAKWLSSVDWYRKATESLQSSQEILNSWFAVEKFSEDSKILSKQLPKPSTTVLSNKTFNEIIDLWIGGDAIRTIQLLLVVSELKFHLYNEVRQAIGYFMPDFSYEPLETWELKHINKLIEHIGSDLQEYLSNNKREIDFLDKFIEKIPEIKRQLDSKNKVFPLLNELNNIFYKNDYCEEYLIKKNY